jgi:iron only hydrogenase large subunit-like protein
MSHLKPDPNKSVHLTIDGHEVTVPEGTRILEAAKKAGVKIPTLCDHPDLCMASRGRPRAVCRICVVECDGRGKLLAACANDVWEGVNVVTSNARILSIRKMIIELILANHPQECLDCIRNTNCELQSLAAEFGIREPVFRHDPANRKAKTTEGATLVRDMGKCVKCGRCVEACQELQTIRNINSAYRSIHYEVGTAYGRTFDEGPCVFCGKCAELCPVGAIYGYEQTAEAWALLHDRESHKAVQIDTALCGAFDGLPVGSVSPGKIVTALKRLGFDEVFDASLSANAVAAEKNRELMNRIKGGGQSAKLPMISGCSAGWLKFAESSYPDLKEHFYTGNDSRRMFSALVAANNTGGTSCVSIEPCIARKFRGREDFPHNNALILTVTELASMFRQAGINFDGLPETDFNTMAEVPPETAATENPMNCKEIQPGIQEAEMVLNGTRIKMLAVYGFANARIILDSIRKGECAPSKEGNAALVHIMSCPHTDDTLPNCKL